MAWFAVLAAAVVWLLWDGQKRGRRFVRSIVFLDALDCGESVDEANRLAMHFGTNPDNDRRSIERADFIRRAVFGGKQLPAIAMAKAKGFNEAW